jgi:hypothetical protein
MRPKPGETAGSLLFRLARHELRAVADYAETEIGQSYCQARSDLDQLIPARHSSRLAHAAGISARIVRGLGFKASESCISSWNPKTRRYDSPIRLCPLCLQQDLFGRRFWRTRFAAACTEHRIELVDRCPNCGTDLPYFGDSVGILTQFWMEAWPICPHCLRPITVNIPAHPVLISITKRWESAILGQPQLGFEANDFLKMSARLIARFENHQEYRRTANLLAPGRHWSAHLAAALLIQSIGRPGFTLNTAHAAIGITFDAGQLAKDIVS